MRNYHFLRFPGGKMRAFTMSYDDGVASDVRLMDIMRKNGLKGTFNINAGFFSAADTDIAAHPTSRLSAAQIKEYYKDFEIATHGYAHPFYRDLPASAAVYDIVRDREELEKISGRIVRGHAYPNGAFTAETMEAFRLSGILYARTTVSTRAFGIPEDFMRYDPTCHHNDDLDGICEKFMAKATYQTSPRLFCLWGHSYEFVNQNNWDKIEAFAEKIGGHEEIWYAGMQEIFAYVSAYRSLVYSMDGSRVYNPTAFDVWLALDVFEREVVCVHAGETREVVSR